jgi:serine/threonine protein kinase
VQLLPLALHVAGALAYLERRGLVHLDVKPDNIVMGVPPRLIDLSIARSFERATRSKGPLGTDAYMAPEQCGPDGFGPMSPASDVWGLGATLHHCISGHRPFPRAEGARDSEDPKVRFPQLHAEAEPLGKNLPDGLEELVAEMLSKDQEKRPSAAQVADRLEPFVQQLPHRLALSRRGRVLR